MSEPNWSANVPNKNRHGLNKNRHGPNKNRHGLKKLNSHNRRQFPDYWLSV